MWQALKDWWEKLRGEGKPTDVPPPLDKPTGKPEPLDPYADRLPKDVDKRRLPNQPPDQVDRTPIREDEWLPPIMRHRDINS